MCQYKPNMVCQYNPEIMCQYDPNIVHVCAIMSLTWGAIMSLTLCVLSDTDCIDWFDPIYNHISDINIPTLTGQTGLPYPYYNMHGLGQAVVGGYNKHQYHYNPRIDTTRAKLATPTPTSPPWHLSPLSIVSPSPTKYCRVIQPAIAHQRPLGADYHGGYVFRWESNRWPPHRVTGCQSTNPTPGCHANNPHNGTFGGGGTYIYPCMSQVTYIGNTARFPPEPMVTQPQTES